MMIAMGKKYQTKSGLPVRILCIDGPTPLSVIGLVNGETISYWERDGTWTREHQNTWNLIPVPAKVEMWAVVYADGDYRTAVAGRFLFSTEAFAQGAADSENREHPSLTHDKAHVALVTWED